MRHFFICILLAWLSALVYSDSPETCADAAPAPPEHFTADEIVPFADAHFRTYFKDCDAFIGAFAEDFEYCDEVPCHGNRKYLQGACARTIGSKNMIHSLAVLPSTFGSDNVRNPNYSKVAVRGKQTVFLVLDATKPAMPVCFDYVINESFKRAIVTEDNPAGIEMTSWIAFYKAAIGGVCTPEQW